jgi:hypothetical protein
MEVAMESATRCESNVKMVEEGASALFGAPLGVNAVERKEDKAQSMQRARNNDWKAPKRKRTDSPDGHQAKRSSTSRGSKTCGDCGFSLPHRSTQCPAKGQTCRKCGKMNHFERVCRSQAKIRRMETAGTDRKVNKAEDQTVEVREETED